MSAIWKGVPGPQNKFLHWLDSAAVKVVNAAGGSVILLGSGKLSYCASDGQVRDLSCTKDTGPIADVSESGSEAEGGDLLVVSAAGFIYQVDVCRDVVVRQVKDLSCRPRVCTAGRCHALLLDGGGRVYSRGLAPQVGLVQDSPRQFQQVPYFSGAEVQQLVAGEDFTLALVQHREAETVTPVAEEEEAAPHCPLGLPLGEEGNVRTSHHISFNKSKEDYTSHAVEDDNLGQTKTLEENLCDPSESTAKICDNLDVSVGGDTVDVSEHVERDVVDSVDGTEQLECIGDDSVDGSQQLEHVGGDNVDGSQQVDRVEGSKEVEHVDIDSVDGSEQLERVGDASVDGSEQMELSINQGNESGVDNCDTVEKLELGEIKTDPETKEVIREEVKPSLCISKEPLNTEDINISLKDCLSDTVSIGSSGSANYLSSGLGLVQGFNRVWNSSVSLISGGSGSTAEAKSLDGEDRILETQPAFKSYSEPPSSTRPFGQDDMELGWNVVVEREGLVSRTSKFSLGHRKSSSHGCFPKHSNAKKPLDLGSLNLVGSKLEKSEVWSWGSGRRGQLGQGDMLARPTPAVIASLVGVGVVNLAAGPWHALALTASGRVYGWGDNSKGQACPNERLAVVLSPALVGLPGGETVRAVGAGGMASLILTDTGKLFILGSAGQDNTSRFQVVNLAALCISPGLQPVTAWFSDQQTVVMNVKKADPPTCKVVSREKEMIDQVSCVIRILDDLNPPISTSPNKLEQQVPVAPGNWPLQGLVTSLREMNGLLRIAVEHSWNCHTLEETRKTGLLAHLSAWQRSFSSVNDRICDCISTDCLLLDSHQAHHHAAIVDALASKFRVKRELIKGQEILEQLFLEIPKLLTWYTADLMAVQLSLSGEEKDQMASVLAELTALARRLERDRQDADRTRMFWKSAGLRLTDLKLAGRRLVLDSRSDPVVVSGHYTRHWLVLLSDLLVDVGYNQVTAHELQTVWMEVLPVHEPSSKYTITLTMPEESLLLVATSSAQRSVWVQGMQRAIYRSITGKRVVDGNTSYNPPVNRTGKYTFTKGELKGNVYSGGWMQGKMHGRGRMEWTDGRVYTGGWRGGQRHGRGILEVPGGGRQEGMWVQGGLTGWGKVVDGNASVYEGDLVEGHPQGHGVKKEGKFMGSGAAVYTGEWDAGLRQGYGVLEDIMAGEKYMGMWVVGVRQGRGCVVTSDGVYYEGIFLNDKLVGGGIMVFEDGARYEGEFAGAGVFSGKGTLDSGKDKLVGSFYGNYTDGMKFSGMVYKNQTPASPAIGGPVDLDIKHFTVEPHLKWTSLFRKFRSLLNLGEPGQQLEAWQQLAILINQNKVMAREYDGKTIEGLDQVEMIPSVGMGGGLDWHQYCGIFQYLAATARCRIHPLYQLLQQLIDSFTASYGGVRSHPTLLPLAKDELDSVVYRLYNILVELFPALPPADKPTWLDNPEKPGEGEMVTPNAVLHTLLLPPLHPTIFMLYALKEQHLDKEYWHRILRWNRHTDVSLLTFLEVDTRFWASNQTSDHRGRDLHFLAAIETLQRLKTTFTPASKLNVVVHMFKDITQLVTDGRLVWSMDSLLPVCMYVVVRARVLQLGAELAMLADLMETHLFQGEQGIMFTTLQAAYLQILKESIFIN